MSSECHIHLCHDSVSCAMKHITVSLKERTTSEAIATHLWKISVLCIFTRMKLFSVPDSGNTWPEPGHMTLRSDPQFHTHNGWLCAQVYTKAPM
ncbi:uncharacterized [Tachysurus ichikawai]